MKLASGKKGDTRTESHINNRIMTVLSNTEGLERNHDSGDQGASIAGLVRRCEELAKQNNSLREEMADQNSSFQEFQERLALLETNGFPQDFFTSRNNQRSDRTILNHKKTNNDLIPTVDAVDDDEAVAHGGIVERVSHLELRLNEMDDKKEERGAHFTCTLQESTFTFFITETPLSAPFIYSFFAVALSMSCLGLTLGYASTTGNSGNPLGIPADVHITVRAAQFLGLLVGK